MGYTEVDLVKDIERVKQISIVPTILDVVCQTTGMGFAAIARVTQDRWIACSVRDEIQFGLVPGGELAVKTTICDEIRDSHEAVIIDHVSESDVYSCHHTPLQYGFQSYISFPIILKNGEFFGTLCAIDPKPALLNNSKIIGMFNLFVDLIAFHLHQIELLERSTITIQTLNRQLTESIDENRQYQYISNHNLQEPLRKIRLLSSLLIDATETNNVFAAQELASKINASAQKFSMMIKDLSDFSTLTNQELFFESVDLKQIISDVCEQLKSRLKARNAVVTIEKLPSIKANEQQLEQLFYHLINNAIKFCKNDEALTIDISSREVTSSERSDMLPAGRGNRFVEIRIKDNGIGIEKSQLEKIFTIFSQLASDNILEGGGIGLAYCRKIVRNHSGSIEAQSEVGQGTTFFVFLPIG